MADHRRPPLPHWGSGPEHCRWCGGQITLGRFKIRRWHDGRGDEPRCLQAYNLATNHDAVRARAKNEGWYYCAECGPPGPDLHGPRGVYVYSDGAMYGHDKSASALVMNAVLRTVENQLARDTAHDYGGRVTATGDRWVPPWGDALACYSMIHAWVLGARGWNATQGYMRRDWMATLEVDHIVPLVDADEHGLDPLGRFGLENLQLLCVPHHKAKTAREAGERAARRRVARGEPHASRPKRLRTPPPPTLF